MDSTRLLPIEISQFQLGLPLRYQVYSEEQELLANAGDCFTERLRAHWSELGLTTVLARVNANDSLEKTSADSQHLLRDYDREAITRIESNLLIAAETVSILSDRIIDKQLINISEIQDVTNDLILDIQADNAAALLALFYSIRNQPNENDKLLASRSSQLSLLSLIIAVELALPVTECRQTGLAALLHDVSLMGLTSELSADDLEERYLQHPVVSAYMNESITGIDPKVCMIMAQVHENLAGNGFPRGLQGARIVRPAHVIHLADSYLTLTSAKHPIAFPESKNLHPSDALAYIMYHTARGKYERESVRGLIRASSLYPVGSHVELSNHSTATVLRSSQIAPSKPIVKLDSQDRSTVDLRFSSLSILKAYRESTPPYHIMRRTELADTTWC